MEEDSLVLARIAQAITTMEEEKARLQRAIDDLQVNIRRQKAKYNKIMNQRLPCATLPNELLVAIFRTYQEIAPAKLPIPVEVALSHVSAHWRYIMLSTPLFWNSFNLDVRPKPFAGLRGQALRRLESHLTRSFPCPLDVALSIGPSEDLYPYLQLLLPHSDRWRKLSIISMDDQANRVYECLRSLEVPRLEHLSLHFGALQRTHLPPVRTQDLPRILLQGTPVLSFVRVAGTALGLLQPPLRNVTTLHLDGWAHLYITLPKVKSILDDLPLLSNLSLNRLHIVSPPEESSPLTLFETTSLRSLRIRGPCRDPYFLLPLLQISNLESLTLSHMDSFHLFEIPTLRSLVLDACTFGNVGIRNLFLSCPGIVTLSIDEYLDDIYPLLGPPDAQLQSLPWPHLRRMIVRAMQPSDVSQFCSMILRRRFSGASLTDVGLDRRSRTVLRARHRLEWLRELSIITENKDFLDPWPADLGYQDPHDLCE